MNNIFDKNVSFLVSLVALAQLTAGIAVVGSGLPAQAETMDTGSTDALPKLSLREFPQQTKTATLTPESFAAATQTPVALVEAPVIDSLATAVSQATVSGGDNQASLQSAVPAVNESNPVGLENSNEPQQLEQTNPTQEAAMPTPGFAYSPGPVPGTTTTSAAPLTAPRAPQLAPASETDESEVAQVDIDPGTPTFGGDSYIGVAGNLGLGGDSALGDSSFMVISKIGLTTRIAVRPSVGIEDDPVVLVPVTFDFSLRPVDAFTERLPIAPYVGGGVAISTGDDSEVGPLLTAGVDFPITPRFTATAAVNAAFLDDTDVGLLLGIGYNFSALGGL